MAGTLTISTLSDGTNSTSSTNCIQGSAKAWVNFSALSGTITNRASYNVSSVTRQATGNYTVNFTNAFTDTNFVAVCGSSTPTAYPNVAATGSTTILLCQSPSPYNTPKSTSSFSFGCVTNPANATTTTDPETVTAAFFR